MNIFPNHIFALLVEMGFHPISIANMTWNYVDGILTTYYGDSVRLPNGEWGN